MSVEHQGETVLFVGGPLDGHRHEDVYEWPVGVVRVHPVLEHSQYAYEVAAPYERSKYQRILAAGADKKLYALGVFAGWPSDGGT